ncbi:MAG: ABC transporter ATP-binding protein [Coriobacteriia bacterium]|nr:ABC transporter ATP-binding protein [Coriobacteriia bacterium]
METKRKNKTIKWIWQISGKTKINIVFLIVLQSLIGITGVLYAWLFRGLVDTAVAHDWNGFWSNAIFLVCLMVLNICVSALLRFIDEYTAATFENNFKTRVFTNILHKDYASVTSTHSGEWLNRLTNDCVIVANGMTTILPQVTGLVVKLIAAIILMLLLVPEFVFVLVPFGLLILIITYLFRKKLKTLHKKIQETDGRLRVFLSERLSNLLIVKAFVREKESIVGAKKRMHEHKQARLKRLAFSNTANVGITVVFTGAYVISAIYCGYGILTDVLTYGTFVAVIQLVNQIQLPFSNISAYVPQYYAMLASAERLMDVEDFSNDSVEPINNPGFNTLKFSHVDFAYDKLPVLKDVNLEINKGDCIAFIGESGIGKSTMLKLLMAIYQPQSGKCLVDNQVITPAYRNLFAYVPQGNFMMSGSIRDAVSFGQNKSDEEIWGALKIACAENFVDNLDRELGEAGSGLSEGQLQRLAIARAIATNNPVLLLDECTSALDSSTESKLLKNLKSMTDRTVVIVTHREAARKICDKEFKINA